MNNAHRDDQHCRRADLVRHSKIVTQIATARISIAAAITHAPFGPRTGMFFGGTAMLPDARTFDTRYRLNTWTLGPAGSLINKTHVWNDDDNLTNITNTPADANNRVFGYDEIHRLTIANGPWGSGGYSYDLNGNRLSKTEGALNATYLYTAGTNRLFSATSATTPGEAGTFSYAGRGSERNQNRVAHGNLSGNISGVDNPAFVLQPPGRGVRAPLFSYSQRDRFSGFDSGLSLAVGYAYTGDGARFKKEIEFVGQGRHNIPIQFFSASGKLLEEFNPAGAVSTNEDFRDYIWLPGTNENVAQIGTSGCVVGPCVDTLYFTHADHLGTPIAMTNTAGALVWRVEQRPFGGIFSQSVATITNNLRFPGQYYDFESGLAQNGFRDYSEKLGRYIEPDPIGTLGSTNIYSYSSNTPQTAADPTGLSVWVRCRLIGRPGSADPRKGLAREFGIVHCWVYAKSPKNGIDKVISPFADISDNAANRDPSSWQRSILVSDGKCNSDFENKVLNAANDWNNLHPEIPGTEDRAGYHAYGPNSNSAAYEILLRAGATDLPNSTPFAVGWGFTWPGYVYP